ncbi:excinuclease ABC subunit UvrA [Microbacter margulisiae]|uniref:UvrABC system protein A n=1 Tax=Microbacter margulisiae TaxID=1350067 RepID=A0A7W5DT57_9PORP|nr:excinuclease ABC subunit UvrA [Microbacter margulisiae]MBB3187783.1 excinuclease ABC subunit A [Microbacter margulisiae]
MQQDIVEKEQIEVYGARVHNLKNIDIVIPRNQLVVVTGLSGSGKSSLAFDTIFAEGQRRYIETFSAYARNFLGNLERPDVDIITGLSPVISIEQKTTNKNPRSTVGTTTEIYDFLRLLFARAGEAHSYVTGEKMIKFTDEEILDRIQHEYQGKKIYLLAPLVRNRKGHYKELFEQIRKKGYLHVRVDGEIRELTPMMRLDRYKNHSIELVIDKLVVSEGDDHRLKASIATGMQQGNNDIMLWDYASNEIRHFSKHLMCPTSGISYSEPAPHNFSFNSPQGACPKCKGLGFVNQIDIDKIIPDRSLSIAQGGIVPLGKHKHSLIFWQIEAIGEKYGFQSKTPISEIPDEALDEILNGSSDPLTIKNAALGTSNYFATFEGVIKYIEMQRDSDASPTEQKWASQFVKTIICPECNGTRLNIEARHYKIGDKTISQLSEMDIVDLYKWTTNIESELSERQKKIAAEILKEIRSRLQFLLDVGLGYLSLNRSSMSLSGGESQRIRLATQIGSQLVNVLYILDEPSIGLHQRDNDRLIHSLKQLRDNGNSIIVVEHDRDMMLAADYVIDLGPHAGRLGGELVFAGTPDQMKHISTLTADYINGKKSIRIPKQRRPGSGKTLVLKGAAGNNLKQVNVTFPLGMLICVTGVSGSGKSSLINDTLHPILSQSFYHSLQDPLPYESIEGMEYIDKVIEVDQSPIGRTPRSNPATYTGIFSDIRSLFVSLPEAKIRGYKPGRFSFNVPGGRCDVCRGNGYKTIEMNFLPDVLVMCEACHGKRYNRETLEVRFKGKSIADVLDLTIDQALEFFDAFPVILQKLNVLHDVGLGYIQLGQPSSTLSGGESQRIKLATELAKKDTGNTLYILDEPTTGLHFEDIKVLLHVINRLVDKGNSVIVIEHNPDVIKSADYIIDMGPEGGKEGGFVIAYGTPEEIVKNGVGPTAEFLRHELT